MSEFVPSPSLPPPMATSGPILWLRKNLFSNWLNSILTLIAIYIIFLAAVPFLNWAVIDANFVGHDRSACSDDGACWIFIKERISFFIYGFYPAEEYWRINILYALIAILFVPQFFETFPYKKLFGWLTLTAFPIFAFFMLVGGYFGLEPVETDKWGGMMLTLVISFVGIVASLPIGILLALGRRSEMPVIRAICIGFIELWRGVPLITVLFMASVMFPLFLPEGLNFDKLLRALIAITMFQAAYIAEVVRGGLQAIPKGQYEAAAALGLGYWKSTGLIILPQALKLVIPGIVNTFIALFKDTTLVLIIGILDLLEAVNVTIRDPAWGAVNNEGYFFAALVFWIFTFGMSRYSQALERKLHTGHNR